MSSLEVVSGVTAIVSAFADGVSLYQKWKSMEIERKSPISLRLDEVVARSTEHSLTTSGPLVQMEYAKNFDQLGHRYARGDDIARSQLQLHLITLQQSIIILLQNALLSGTRSFGKDCLTEPNLLELLRASDTVRNGVIESLAQQYQRMSIGTPLTANPPPLVISPLPAKPPYCKFAMKLQQDPFHAFSKTANWMRSFGSKDKVLACPACKAHVGSIPQGPTFVLYGIIRKNYYEYWVDRRFLLKCHEKGEDDLYWCVLCAAKGKSMRCHGQGLGQGTLIYHLENDHETSDFRKDPHITLNRVVPPFCDFALKMQERPLDPVTYEYDDKRGWVCPTCKAIMQRNSPPNDGRDQAGIGWTIEIHGTRYFVDQRFGIKCHQGNRNGLFAWCTLCAKKGKLQCIKGDPSRNISAGCELACRHLMAEHKPSDWADDPHIQKIS